MGLEHRNIELPNDFDAVNSLMKNISLDEQKRELQLAASFKREEER